MNWSGVVGAMEGMAEGRIGVAVGLTEGLLGIAVGLTVQDPRVRVGLHNGQGIPVPKTIEFVVSINIDWYSR